MLLYMYNCISNILHVLFLSNPCELNSSDINLSFISWAAYVAHSFLSSRYHALTRSVFLFCNSWRCFYPFEVCISIYQMSKLILVCWSEALQGPLVIGHIFSFMVSKCSKACKTKWMSVLHPSKVVIMGFRRWNSNFVQGMPASWVLILTCILCSCVHNSSLWIQAMSPIVWPSTPSICINILPLTLYQTCRMILLMPKGFNHRCVLQFYLLSFQPCFGFDLQSYCWPSVNKKTRVFVFIACTFIIHTYFYLPYCTHICRFSVKYLVAMLDYDGVGCQLLLMFLFVVVGVVKPLINTPGLIEWMQAFGRV